MSISRRELYALGEPIGDSATYRKVDGGLVFGDGGGDGGGGGGQPANTTTQQTQELPEWARPYAKDVLAKGKALTDLGQNPYQTYGGERTAGFSNLQKQSFAQAGPQGYQATVGQYMSPYLENVLQNQMASANRQYDITGMQQRAGATTANAFGGGRDAVMRMENERARNSALQGIAAKGYQDAFTGATNQYNTGLGQLQTLGAQQQAQRQKELDVPYQEFLNQQNQPYKQLSYMSDLIRGQPLGMQSSNQVYQAPPSALSQAAGLGTAGIAGLGLYNAMSGSDIRLKENVTLVGKLDNGLGLYKFEYKPEFKNHPACGHGCYVGVMAHEVEEHTPSAVVTMDNGYKAVKYDVIGVQRVAV